MATNALIESLKLVADERICLSCYMAYIEVWLPEKLGCLCSHVFPFNSLARRHKHIPEERSACLALYLCRLPLWAPWWAACLQSEGCDWGVQWREKLFAQYSWSLCRQQRCKVTQLQRSPIGRKFSPVHAATWSAEFGNRTALKLKWNFVSPCCTFPTASSQNTGFRCCWMNEWMTSLPA